MTSPQRLLVVDDDPINLDIMTEFLADPGFSITTESDSLRARDLLDSEPSQFDIVLLDWMMPNLDGLELLKHIKSTTALAQMPVIMQTANGTKPRVAEAIAAGAFYFLTKPLDPDELLAIVRSAAEDLAGTRDLLNELHRGRRSLQKLRHGVFHIQCLNEAHDLGVSLANACLEPERVVVGLKELLVNAIEHGNLGITYEDKSRLKQDGTWLDEIERRLQLENYKDRFVQIDFQRSNDHVVVTIIDQGAGFEWQKYLEFDPARAFDSHGRGIAMSKMLSFESLQYAGNGNRVTVSMPASH